MALSSSVVFEVRTGGSDTNGGGFKTGASGTDWTLQNAAQYSVTDAVTNGTTTITSATAAFGTDVVGNVLYIQGGTGSIAAGWYEITARTNSTTITVDRSTGLTTGTGATLKIGGALATPGAAVPLMTVAGIKTYIKSGTYTMTTATAGAAGPVTFPTVDNIQLIGYNATRGDLGTSPVLSAGTVTFGAATNLVKISTDYNIGQQVVNLKVDGNSRANTRGFEGNNANNAKGLAYKCQAVNCAVRGFLNCVTILCRADTCVTGFDECLAFGCVGSNNTSYGFYSFSSFICSCLAYSNGTGFYLEQVSTTYSCTAHGNTSHGFSNNNQDANYINCIATSNGGYGFNNGSGRYSVYSNCATHGNTSGVVNTTNHQIAGAFIALSGNPFTNAAAQDFSLTNSGGGAQCRAAGILGSAAGFTTTTGYQDIGAFQHQDSGSSATTIAFTFAG